ncbi:MAG: methyltransferase domain-containing protein [Elusimicrobia bacterium]|nr:methyltransferase domain-containing protein [Elusimicrobiota bacterium]
MDFVSRLDAVEIMDTVELAEPELRDTLAFLQWLNRWFGGCAVVLRHLSEWSARWPQGRPVTILDVGTGSADIPLRILRWAKDKGFDVRVTAIDSTPAIARLARESAAGARNLEIVESDLSSFAREGKSFDYVTASLVLHHVPPAAVDGFLRDCDRCAARGVLINDLERSFPAYLGAKLVTLFGNKVVRNDGPISVRRAFTPSELSGSARAAGLAYLVARRHPFFRLSLAGEKVPHG